MASSDNGSSVRKTLERWSALHPYAFAHDLCESRYIEGAGGDLADLLTLLSAHDEWTVDDLIAVDGREFIELAVTALRGRLPRPAEYQRAETARHVWQKLTFLLELDAENRSEKRRARINIRWSDRLLWRLHRRLTAIGLSFAGRLAFAYFRWRARRMGTRLAPATSLRRLLFALRRRVRAAGTPVAQPLRRIVIANLYPVWPVMHGGQRRVFFLARELSRRFDVEIVTPQVRGGDRMISFSPTLREIRIRTDPGYDRLLAPIEATVEMASDAGYALHWRSCRAYQAALAERLAMADLCISSHAYSIHALLDARGERAIPLVYDAHNVEIRLKTPLLKEHPAYLAAVRDVEATALQRADLTVCCSQEDAQGLSADYGLAAADLRVIANGVDAASVPSLAAEERRRIRAALGTRGSQRLAIFAGSYHYPNFQATDRILALAEQMPDVTFLFLGSVGGYAALKRRPLRNVIVLGEVDESTKWLAFLVCDIALNPIETGSGSNIKTFEYAAAGLVVLSTRFGARGVPPELRDQFVLCEPAEFETRLRDLVKAEDADLRRIGSKTRAAALACADWSVIGRRYARHIDDLLDRSAGEALAAS